MLRKKINIFIRILVVVIYTMMSITTVSTMKAYSAGYTGAYGKDDGTYDFSGKVGRNDSAGPGFATFSDKFVISNDFEAVGSQLWSMGQQVANTTGILEIKAEGNEVKAFTFKDLGISSFEPYGYNLSYLSVELRDNTDNLIATLTNSEQVNLTNTTSQLSDLLNGGSKYNYKNISHITIRWAYAGGHEPSNLNFDNITIADISNVIPSIDTEPPVSGNDGLIVSSNITSSSVKLDWTPAIDNFTTQGDLEYQIYQSTSSNFNTMGEVESGIPVSDRFTKDLNTLDVTGLSPNTIYYFNVLVRDEAGNKSIYKSAQVKTKNSVSPLTLPFTQTFDLVPVGTESEKNEPLILDGIVYSTDAINEALHVDIIDNSGNTIGSGNALNAIWYGTNSGSYFQFSSEDQINNFKMTSIELDMWDHTSQNAEKYVVTGYDDGMAKASVLVDFKTEKGVATNYTDESSNPNSELSWTRNEGSTGDYTGGKLTFKGSLWANIDTVRFTVADIAPHTILGAVVDNIVLHSPVVNQTPATSAIAANNNVSANHNSIIAGENIVLTATGDRQSAAGTVINDERYIPTTWSSTENGKIGNFTESNGTYTSTYTPGIAGDYTVTATFQKQLWNGSTWVDVVGQTDTKTVNVTVIPAIEMSSNADLSNLTISTGPLNPVFSKDKISYTAIVPFISSTIIVTPTLDDSKATMMLMINNRLEFEHEPMLLNMGENIINIFVTAENQSITKIYTIKVYRLFPPPIVRGDDENNVLIPDTDAPIEYQINGGTWTTFDLANPPDLSGDKTVKVRYPANISTGQPASEEATLIFTENPKTESAPPHVTEATTEEDTMSTSGLVITPDAQDNNGVTHYKISEITGGTLYKNDGTFPIGNGDFITKAEGEAGLKFHPDSDANTLAGDSFSVKVQASLDGTGSGLSEAATASITVTEVNDAPIAADDQLSEKVMTSEGIEIPFGELLQNDQAGPENENAQTLAIVSVSDIAGGTVHLEGKKVIFNPSGTGTASFNYTIQDNGTTDGTGDPKTASATVQFNVISKPLIYLEGDHTIYIELGSQYVEPRYTATDEIDGDLTDKVTVTGTVDRNQLGTYTLKYNVKNSKDVFAAEITRVVHVVSANLETLSVSSGNLIPSFDPMQTNYHLTVPSNATSIDISAGTLDETASATLNGETIGNSGSRLITLRPGVNAVSIVITTQGGMTKSYTLEIIRQFTHAEVPVILHQPADQTVSIGGEADLSVNATATNGGLSYQWYFNTTNSSVDGVLIPGATSATYSAPTSVIGTTYYYVKVTNTDSSATGNNTAEATSEVAAVTVNALTHAAVPAITVQPENKTVSVGDAADLSVDATAVKGELSYQWYSNTTNSNSGGTLIPSATNAIYAVPTGDAGTTYYYVKVTNTDSSATGNNTAEATSKVAAVTVKAKSTNAYLDDLTLSSGVLSPVFTKDRETYTVNVPNSVNNITFTPVVEDIGKATVTVNGQSSTTAVPLTVGVNVIKVVVTAEDGVTKNTYTITVNRAQPSSSGGNGSTPAPQPDPTPTPQPTTEQIVVDVDGNNGSHLTKTPITRTTEPNGTVKDKVAMTDAIAKETVQKAKEQGVDTASIIIPDKEDKVTEVLVEVPQSALDELNNGKLKLEIVTRNAVVSIPTKSLNNFEGNLYLRVVPIKSESEKQQVEDRAKNESLIQEAIGNNTVQVIGRPMEIETNMQSHEVTIMLPLTANLPTNAAEREKLLTNLGVYIEHSDSSKELIKGTVVKMQDGSEGLQFTVNKFSTFTMVYLEGWEDEAADETLHTPYIKGYGNNEFRPEASVTRAQMATMLARNINAAPSKQAYTDIPTKHGAYEAIMEVKGAGIMMGKNVSTFDPNGTVTRAQMAAIVYHWVQNQCKQDAASYAGCAILKDIPVADFKDVKDNHWAKEAMNFTKATGIMVGDSKGQFRPEENLTRAQAVKVLNRLFKRGPLTGITTPTFKDVSATHWAFSEIEEAAREHLSSLDTTK